MRIKSLLLLATSCVVPALGQYVYDWASLLNPYNSGQWWSTGDVNASTNLFTSVNGGSLIFTNSPLQGPSDSYEVKTTLALAPGTSGGHYISYLRASVGSILGGAGTFYAVELANPTFSGSSCVATLNIYKQVSGTLSNPYSSTIGCHNGMVIRSIMLQAGVVAVFVDNFFWTSWGWGDASPITYGQPGVGVSGAPYGNGISAIDIGHLDTVSPNPINSNLVGYSAYPNHVDFQFPGTTDDASGTGVAFYQFYRNGSWINMTLTPNFSDATVAPNTTYTYILQAQDYHYNNTSVTITVTTPPAGEIDAREVGVRPLGSYWGGAGEQIDMRALNLNYTIPLVKAVARSGWGATFNLSYNSQQWRQDPGGIWALGRDVATGLAGGCRLGRSHRCIRTTGPYTTTCTSTRLGPSTG